MQIFGQACLLEAGTWAPSGKNGQQWRFTVLTGSSKKEATTLFRHELEKLSAKIGKAQMGSSFNSCYIMEEAPVLIIVWTLTRLNGQRSLCKAWPLPFKTCS